MSRNVVVVTEIGVAAVRDGKLFVEEGKLARVNEEKGNELGANLDRSGQAVDLTETWRPISEHAKVRSFFGHRAEPVW
jgi:hypothetical protein